MSEDSGALEPGGPGEEKAAGEQATATPAPRRSWLPFSGRSRAKSQKPAAVSDPPEDGTGGARIERWSLGVLNDKLTDEVPGSILLMSKQYNHNEPLGLQNAPARTSASSLPSPYPPGSEPTSPRMSLSSGPRPTPPRTPTDRPSRPSSKRLFSTQTFKSARSLAEEKKKTADGKFILEPQPDDSLNDPLNWPAVRRDVALLSLGLYCMIGGGMTPVLAAGYNNISKTYDIPVPTVALSTGFYMAGLGVGSVIASPTAILFGKRPVYLFGICLLIVTSIWCALSPSYASLVIARVVQGIAISPIECLPSATVAEIFFLHERAYRLGIYTLLLLGGKNLVPLISAAIIQGLDWHWVFWIVAMFAAFCLVLIILFVPETFWDRTPRPGKHHKKHTMGSLKNLFHAGHHEKQNNPISPLGSPGLDSTSNMDALAVTNGTSFSPTAAGSTIVERRSKAHHVGFADQTDSSKVDLAPSQTSPPGVNDEAAVPRDSSPEQPRVEGVDDSTPHSEFSKAPELRNHNSSYSLSKAEAGGDHVDSSQNIVPTDSQPRGDAADIREAREPGTPTQHTSGTSTPLSSHFYSYTSQLQTAPPKTYLDTLRPWNGRLRKDNWFKVAIRPFILFAYPAILWSSLVYSLSIGWLIVLSESVSEVYRNKDTYNFTALQTGLVYLSPFIGGVLGTAVAGKVSDIIVRYLSRKNGGIYEPEFRLVMALPVMISTCIGLMGFGWSAQERDNYMVPTIFFGVISFGCSLGSTTAITFAVDSYRQYAGEALVTMNFSKNIFHGLVFSLFFPHWLVASGSKEVFLAIGGIQIACLLTTIPMYIYGKRARMWTVRKNMMEKF